MQFLAEDISRVIIDVRHIEVELNRAADLKGMAVRRHNRHATVAGSGHGKDILQRIRFGFYRRNREGPHHRRLGRQNPRHATGPHPRRAKRLAEVTVFDGDVVGRLGQHGIFVAGYGEALTRGVIGDGDLVLNGLPGHDPRRRTRFFHHNHRYQRNIRQRVGLVSIGGVVGQRAHVHREHIARLAFRHLNRMREVSAFLSIVRQRSERTDLGIAIRVTGVG